MKTERLAAAIPSMNRTFKVEDAQTHADFNSIGLLKPHDLAVLKLEDASQQIDQSSRLCVSTKAADNRDLIVLKSQFDFQTSPFIQVQPNWISTSFFRIPLIDRNSALFCSSRPDQYCGQAFAPVFEDKDVGAPLLVRTNGQWSIASVLSVFDQKKVIATRLVDKNLIWLQWLLRDQLCIL